MVVSNDRSSYCWAEPPRGVCRGGARILGPDPHQPMSGAAPREEKIRSGWHPAVHKAELKALDTVVRSLRWPPAPTDDLIRGRRKKKKGPKIISIHNS